MEKSEDRERAAILAGTEKAVLEELGRKEMGKVAWECGMRWRCCGTSDI